MSANKATVERSFAAFNRADRAQILALLADDVVVAEGTVTTRPPDCALFTLLFRDLFHLRDAKITHLTSHLAQPT